MRVRLKDIMEIVHLPHANDNDKGIERDEHFYNGGFYKSVMNKNTSNVDVDNRAKIKKIV